MATNIIDFDASLALVERMLSAHLASTQLARPNLTRAWSLRAPGSPAPPVTGNVVLEHSIRAPQTEKS